MKSNFKWVNGSTVTAKDAVFFLNLLKAAIKEDPSNFGNYSAGLGIPDQIKSITMPNASTFVLNLNKSVNPLWFDDNELALISRLSGDPGYAGAAVSRRSPSFRPSRSGAGRSWR